MKKNIHPEYHDTSVTCSCGATFTTRSTAASGAISADVSSQKIRDTGGRVARVQERYGKKAASK